MKTVLRLGVAVIGLLGVASCFVHPFGPVKNQRSTGPLLVGAETTPAIIRTFERSCRNCHSERTEWPWYSYVAPLSWLIENDVHRARNHMNLSRWQVYTVDQQIELLTKLGVEVRNRRMPLPKYLQLHPEAELSDHDVEQLNTWAHSERQRLRVAATTSRHRTPTE